MRKSVITLFLMAMPMAIAAQNTWEKPEEATPRQQESTTTETREDPKYMEGAVPVNNGRVEWTLHANAPGKTAAEIYDTMLLFLTAMTKEENQLESSNVALVNKQEHVIVAHFNEWLVFKSMVFSLDRTRFVYNLTVECSDGGADVTLSRISYVYPEQKGDKLYKAETWITDQHALNKKRTKLYPIPGKFRKKTIDRKNQIFDSIIAELNK